MRFRVAILAVLVFALVDFVQGLGVLGATEGSSPQHHDGASEAFTYQSAGDAAPVLPQPAPVPPTTYAIRWNMSGPCSIFTRGSPRNRTSESVASTSP
jgi:hypothetical protein